MQIQPNSAWVTNDRPPRLYTLQMFRGLAAILVLMAHATLFFDSKYVWGVFSEGTTGVDFFFVLSGFIIYFFITKISATLFNA